MTDHNDDRNPSGPSDVLFEHRRIGAVVRVAAIDAATNTEVVVSGPADAGDAVLETMARRKLAYVLARRGTPQP
jgi:hypothetical protein